MSQELREILERMTVELGEKRGDFWQATFTVKEVLERQGEPNTPGNQRYVRYTVEKWYFGSKTRIGQADNGGFIDMKIRTK
jgi:hypothetical protein